ncbi:uncharacterized protein METZ01_LOCUS415752, partial [marine metagenome]
YATYYFDFDGDELGAGEGIVVCNNLEYEGWVTNDDDTDDDCTSNVHDCAGVCDGNSLEDNCGTCDNAPDNDCVQDCDGEWGGDLVDDECGVCGGDNTTCADCNAAPNGDAVLDMCGNCDNIPENDCVQDCAGEWGGNAEIETYYFDFDNDGLGAGESFTACNNLQYDGWVSNGDDTDDDCTSNVHDCADVCDGDSWISDCGCVADGNSGDECDDCNDDPYGIAEEDSCGVCSGGNTGHVADSDLDDCGVCNGNNADNLGCGCFEPGPSGCDNTCG